MMEHNFGSPGDPAIFQLKRASYIAPSECHRPSELRRRGDVFRGDSRGHERTRWDFETEANGCREGEGQAESLTFARICPF